MTATAGIVRATRATSRSTRNNEFKRAWGGRRRGRRIKEMGEAVSAASFLFRIPGTSRPIAGVLGRPKPHRSRGLIQVKALTAAAALAPLDLSMSPEGSRAPIGHYRPYGLVPND
jgi:hypothetical protein